MDMGEMFFLSMYERDDNIFKIFLEGEGSGWKKITVGPISKMIQQILTQKLNKINDKTELEPYRHALLNMYRTRGFSLQMYLESNDILAYYLQRIIPNLEMVWGHFCIWKDNFVDSSLQVKQNDHVDPLLLEYRRLLEELFDLYEKASCEKKIDRVPNPGPLLFNNPSEVAPLEEPLRDVPVELTCTL